MRKRAFLILVTLLVAGLAIPSASGKPELPTPDVTLNSFTLECVDSAAGHYVVATANVDWGENTIADVSISVAEYRPDTDSAVSYYPFATHVRTAEWGAWARDTHIVTLDTEQLLPDHYHRDFYPGGVGTFDHGPYFEATVWVSASAIKTRGPRTYGPTQQISQHLWTTCSDGTHTQHADGEFTPPWFNYCYTEDGLNPNCPEPTRP